MPEGVRRYVEASSAGIWLVSMLALWARILLTATGIVPLRVGGLDEVLFVSLLVSALILFVLIARRAVEVGASEEIARGARLKRLAVLLAVATLGLIGMFLTMTARVLQAMMDI